MRLKYSALSTCWAPTARLGLAAEIGLEQAAAPARGSTGTAGRARGSSLPAARPGRARAACRARCPAQSRSRPAPGRAACASAPADAYARPATTVGVLRRRRARDRDQRLAGRVGDQMQMEIIGAAMRHGNGRTSCGTLGRRPRLPAGCKHLTASRPPKRPHRRSLDSESTAAGVDCGRCRSATAAEPIIPALRFENTAEIAIQRHPQASVRTVGIAGQSRGLAVDAQA